MRITCLMFSLVTNISLLVSSIPFSFAAEESHFPTYHRTSSEEDSGRVFLSWDRKERLLADNSSGEQQQQQQVDSVDLVLAPRRTYRKDPFDGFKMYTGGWNISNRHYWASVGYTAVLFFVIAIIWFTTFGLCLFIVCICYCCCREEPYGYSRIAYALSLIFLVLFTIIAIIGCIVLYVGQDKFNISTTSTLEYVVHQADGISDNLKNVSEYLSEAKQINMVGQVSLPPTVQTDIDQIQTNVDSSARTLTDKTDDNSKKIKNLIESVRLALIILTVAMLILTFLGFGVPILLS